MDKARSSPFIPGDVKPNNERGIVLSCSAIEEALQGQPGRAELEVTCHKCGNTKLSVFLLVKPLRLRLVCLKCSASVEVELSLRGHPQLKGESCRKPKI